jgi:hypothetical protein
MPPFIKISIGSPAPWLIKAAAEAGFNLDGFVHEVTDHFRNHVIKRHGDLAAHGTTAIVDEDLSLIPGIIATPDTAIIGAVRYGIHYIIYAKADVGGNYLYFEQILDSRRNKSLRGSTFYKVLRPLTLEKIIGIVTMNGKTDLSKAKVLSPVKL